MIPTTRPVIGEDLATIRERLGLSTGDSCWLYATSMTKWADMTSPKKTPSRPVPNAKRPLADPTLAIMVRALDAHLDASPLPQPAPSAAELFEKINEICPIDRKKFVIMFGAEASSGTRWVTSGRKAGASQDRLFLIFNTLLDEALSKSTSRAEEFLDEWKQMVLEEGQRRGISDVFKVGRWSVSDAAQRHPTLGRPVIGEDLDALREQLGLTTQDACWLFGMPVNRWTMIAKHPGKVRKIGATERYHPGTKDPVPSAALALLVRVLKKRPDACPLSQPVSPETIFKTLLLIRPETDKKRFSILFGSEASSGYRWLRTGVVSAPVARLFKVFMNIAGPDRNISRSRAALKAWEDMVETEATARGIREIFKVGRWSDPEHTNTMLEKKAKAADERRQKRLSHGGDNGKAKRSRASDAADRTIAHATRGLA